MFDISLLMINIVFQVFVAEMLTPVKISNKTLFFHLDMDVTSIINNRIFVLSQKFQLTPRTPDQKVGGSSPTRIAVLCP